MFESLIFVFSFLFYFASYLYECANLEEGESRNAKFILFSFRTVYDSVLLYHGHETCDYSASFPFLNWRPPFQLIDRLAIYFLVFLR